MVRVWVNVDGSKIQSFSINTNNTIGTPYSEALSFITNIDSSKTYIGRAGEYIKADKSTIDNLKNEKWASPLSTENLNDEDERIKDKIGIELRERRVQDVFPSLKFDLLESYEIEDYRSLINNSNILKELEKLRDYPIETSFEWDIQVRVSNDEDKYKASDIGFLLWSLAEGLEKIDGVKVLIEDLKKGSIIANFKLIIKDAFAKEEVKDILNKTKDAVESQYLDRPIEEVKKTQAEREKIEKETKNLPNEDESKELLKLEIERKKLENEALKIKIGKDKLDLLVNISELVAKGLVKNDSNLQFSINDVLFFEVRNNEFSGGEDIEIIEEDQKVILPKNKDSKEANTVEE